MKNDTEKTRVCPVCQRVVGVKFNQWRDLVYIRHNGGRRVDRPRYQGGPYVEGDPNKLAELCPGSGQVVGSELTR
jgi:hypothetical protein